jgi:hypothetical protein
LILFHAYLILLRFTSSVPAFRRRHCHYRAPHNQETLDFCFITNGKKKKTDLGRHNYTASEINRQILRDLRKERVM